jgi:hypothetical protein
MPGWELGTRSATALRDSSCAYYRRGRQQRRAMNWLIVNLALFSILEHPRSCTASMQLCTASGAMHRNLQVRFSSGCCVKNQALVPLLRAGVLAFQSIYLAGAIADVLFISSCRFYATRVQTLDIADLREHVTCRMLRQPLCLSCAQESLL